MKNITEMAKSLTFIDPIAMKDFFYNNYNEVVGKNGTTVGEEVAEVFKLIGKACINDGVSYYRARRSYIIAELGEDEVKRLAERNYKSAAAKLLWLNSKCKDASVYGFGFITKKVDKSNARDCEELAMAFEYCAAHFQEVIDYSKEKEMA